jgi:DNA polymerase-3 subunit delta
LVDFGHGAEYTRDAGVRSRSLGFDGDDKTKSARARKFFGAIRDVVEFRRFSVDEGCGELDRIARAANVKLDRAASEALVEALAADVGRIAIEIEKLSLYGKPITADEYLPLALTFLATQFRIALVAKEANLRGASEVQGHFQRAGVQMWGSRAEQVSATTTKFSREHRERGLKLIFETDGI